MCEILNIYVYILNNEKMKFEKFIGDFKSKIN